MKADVLTLAALIFLLGLLISAFGGSKVFDDDEPVVPSALQQGIATKQR